MPKRRGKVSFDIIRSGELRKEKTGIEARMGV